MGKKKVSYKNLMRRLYLVFFLPSIALFGVAFLAFALVYHDDETEYFFALEKQLVDGVYSQLEEGDTVMAGHLVEPLFGTEIRSNMVTDAQGEVIIGDAPKGYKPETLENIDTDSRFRRYNGTLCLDIVSKGTDNDLYYHMVVPVAMKYRSLVTLFFILIVTIGLSIALSLYLCRKYLKNSIYSVIFSQHRMERELEIAHDVQLSLVPDNGVMKTIENVRIYGFLQPAREVGGDLYDYIQNGDDLYFCVGDVSDKGTPAALLMSTIKCVFHYAASQCDAKIEDIVTVLNNMMCNDEKTDMFCTFFAGKLNLKTYELTYVNCGHDAPLMNGKTLPVNPNCPLGVVPDYKYVAQNQQLSANDTLMIYTDGVTDAKTVEQKFFGSQRLREFTVGHIADTPENQGKNLMSAIADFRGKALQNDDITLLILKLN